MLPLVLQELGSDSEEVEFDLKEANDDLILLELLERGELDVAFIELPLPGGDARGDAAARRSVRADRPRRSTSSRASTVRSRSRSWPRRR